MTNKIFKTKRTELSAMLKNVLSDGLKPLFKLYLELYKMAGNPNHELRLELKTLSRKIGFSSTDVQHILHDLALLSLIELRISKGEKYYEVKLLVY